MKKNWVLSPESFEALLDWLDADRERAGQKYEEIRQRLIKIFTCRGCHEADSCADETIDRVTSKLSEIQSHFIGNRAPYFYAVANRVHMEYLRTKPVQPPPVLTVDSDQLEKEYACLEECLTKETDENRSLVLEYYQDEGIAKIEHRRQLAEKMRIAPNALRIRAYRIRASLQECVLRCLNQTER